MQQSANYALKLPEGTDNVKRQDFVDNFTAIDTQLKAINDNSYPDITATGTNAYVGTSDRIKALAKGTKLTLFVGTDATGNCTLNLNSYGAKNIKDSFGNIVNNIKANIPYNLCYNGTDFILQGKGGGGNALPSEIIKNKTATTDAGPVVGTLDLNNLVSGNIKSGVTINGVSGSQTVVDTADAVLDPAYLVSGYSGYDDGVKKNGTLPNFGSLQNAKDTWTDGNGTLRARIPGKGAFTDLINGYAPELNLYDGNFIASNIISGSSIFGLAGTRIPRYYASGTATCSPTSLIYSSINGKTYSFYPVTVAGLCFTPNVIVVHCIGANGYEDVCVYVAGGVIPLMTVYNYPFNMSSATCAVNVTGNAYVSGGSFSMPMYQQSAGLTVTWYAWY